MSNQAIESHNLDDGWANVPNKKKKRRKKPGETRASIQHNPYIECIEPTSNCTYEPFMILLVGLPGSGKSTFAQTLEVSMPDKFCRINQDQLKTRKKCVSKLKQVLSSSDQRLCPIIDRCNFDAKQRSTWYQLAEEAPGQRSSSMETKIVTDTNKETEQSIDTPQVMRVASPGMPVDVVVFDLPFEECLRRCENRKGHETIKPRQAAGILKQLRSEWNPPHYRENGNEKFKYRSMKIVRTNQERKACLLQFLNQTC